MIGIDYGSAVCFCDRLQRLLCKSLRKKIKKCYNPYYEVTCAHCRYTGNIGEASVASGHLNIFFLPLLCFTLS